MAQVHERVSSPSEGPGRAISTVTQSYAILKVAYDQEGHDYIDNFVPFAAEAMRHSESSPISVAEIQSLVRDRFRLTIPQGALRTILGRAAKRGLCKVDQHMYSPATAAIDRLNFQTLFDKAIDDQRQLVINLTTYSGSRLLTPWTNDQAEKALLDYVNARGPSLLACALTGKPLTDIAPTSDESFVLNSFVQELQKSSPGDLQRLATVVEGSLLATSLYFPDLARINQRFQSLDAYFDTRVLLHALGYAGPEVQAPVREMFDLLLDLGAQLKCFDHTVSEMRRVLAAAQYALTYHSSYQKQSGEVVEYLTRVGYRPSDVELMIARLERSITEMRVSVTPHPDHSRPLTIDETRLESLLRARIKYPRDEALKHDLDSVTAIFRLRHGEERNHLETAGAIFVTTNDPLAYVTREFFAEEYGRSEIPLALPDYQMATLAWLKKPVAAPDLPLKYLIADSYASFVPNDELWRRYLEELARLQGNNDISEEDYVLLRYNMAARAALMDMTRGRPDAFAADTVPTILARARNAIGAELKPAIRAELLPAIEADTRRQIDDEYRARLRGAQDEAERARREADRLKLLSQVRSDQQKLRIQGISDKWAHRILMTPVGILSVALLITLYQGLGWLVPQLSVPQLPIPAWLSIPLSVLGLITGAAVLLMLFLNVLGNWNLLQLNRSAERGLSSCLQRFLARVLVSDAG